jgi:hypothetical protein
MQNRGVVSLVFYACRRGSEVTAGYGQNQKEAYGRLMIFCDN